MVSRPVVHDTSELLLSLRRNFVTTEVLRRRAFYHACMFGAFSVFWTAAPLWLSGPQFGLTQRGIAWVALAGVAGAVAPPVAGRMADKGFGQWGTVAAMLLAAAAFLVSDLANNGSRLALGLVIACAILLDFAVFSNLVFSQRTIYSLRPEQRSRVNGLFMAIFCRRGDQFGAERMVLFASRLGRRVSRRCRPCLSLRSYIYSPSVGI